jgi:hypothetical protein
MWKYKEEYKLDKPETIGETDYTFDLDNYREWLEEQLTECRKQLSIANVVGQSEQLVCDCMPDPKCRVKNGKVICNGCNKERKYQTNCLQLRYISTCKIKLDEKL